MVSSSEIPWIVSQAPLSMGFSSQEYWSGLPFPTPVDLPDPRTESASLTLAGKFFTTETPGKPPSLRLYLSYMYQRLMEKETDDK